MSNRRGRLAWKLLAYVLCTALLVSGINAWYQKWDDTSQTKKFQNMPEKIQICNFGSSHGLYGFCYDKIQQQYGCFNFALSSQMLSYDARIFEAYQDRIQKGAAVFLPVSYFSLYGKAEELAGDFESKNRRYYKILPKEKVKDYHLETDIYVRIFPVLSAYENILKTALQAARGNRESVMEEWDKKASDIPLLENARAAAERHVITDKLDESGNRICNQEEISALYRLAALCRESGARPVIVTTPFLKEYQDAVREADTSFQEDFYRLMEEIAESTGAEYYDYSSDERFAGHPELFMDSDHLNKAGAEQFVEILVKEVIAYEPDTAKPDPVCGPAPDAPGNPQRAG